MLRSEYRWFLFGLTCLMLVLPHSVTFSQTEESDGSNKAPMAQLDAETKSLHDKLSKYLSGTQWTGQFTMDGKDEPRTEHYEIITAEKGEIGDYWNLVARIKYGEHDKTFPLPPIEIKFAGGTPVITIDKVFFPGFGTFDARVLIRKGQYAGTWAHVAGEKGGGVGGHMFGTIEKMDAEELKKKTETLKENKQKTESAEPRKAGADGPASEQSVCSHNNRNVGIQRR